MFAQFVHLARRRECRGGQSLEDLTVLPLAG